MYLFYIRHGQSANNALYDATGGDDGRVMDPELTPVGVEQAARVAESLRCGQPLLRMNGTGADGFWDDTSLFQPDGARCAYRPGDRPGARSAAAGLDRPA